MITSTVELPLPRGAHVFVRASGPALVLPVLEEGRKPWCGRLRSEFNILRHAVELADEHQCVDRMAMLRLHVPGTYTIEAVQLFKSLNFSSPAFKQTCLDMKTLFRVHVHVAANASTPTAAPLWVSTRARRTSVAPLRYQTQWPPSNGTRVQVYTTGEQRMKAELVCVHNSLDSAGRVAYQHYNDQTLVPFDSYAWGTYEPEHSGFVPHVPSLPEKYTPCQPPTGWPPPCQQQAPPQARRVCMVSISVGRMLCGYIPGCRYIYTPHLNVDGHWFNSSNCDNLLMVLGNADAAYKGTPPAKFEHKLRGLFKAERAWRRAPHTTQRRWLLTLAGGPVSCMERMCPPADWRYLPMFDAYNAAIRRIAAAYPQDVRLLDTTDIWRPLWDAGDDWVHPNKMVLRQTAVRIMEHLVQDR